MSTVLITGANGFIGRNLKVRLKEIDPDVTILSFTRDHSSSDLKQFVAQADFVFHLAGINRPDSVEEFYQGNAGLTEQIVDELISQDRHIPLLFSSSTQAEADNDYGKSKLAAEGQVARYRSHTSAAVYLFRLQNVFGKWCKPNYNSVVATFCHNIARDLPIQVSDPEVQINFVYIDDVVATFAQAFQGRLALRDVHQIAPSYTRSLGELVESLTAFRQMRQTLMAPVVLDGFQKKLYSTYLTYLPEDQFSYPLTQHRDDRGDFVEIIKSDHFGQVSFSTSKPGVVRGNHYHHTKTEKFIVVRGEAIIAFRHIESDAIIEYRVTGQRPEVVDIPPGYTHSLENVGEGELLVIFWANEQFNPDVPDTYFEEVRQQCPQSS